MNYDFDFNIDNYNIGELEKFLSLNKNYNFNDINEKCGKMNIIIIENHSSSLLLLLISLYYLL